MDDMILFTVLLAKGKVVLIIENYGHVFCLYSRKMSEMLPEERVCICAFIDTRGSRYGGM